MLHITILSAKNTFYSFLFAVILTNYSLVEKQILGQSVLSSNLEVQQKNPPLFSN